MPVRAPVTWCAPRAIRFEPRSHEGHEAGAGSSRGRFVILRGFVVNQLGGQPISGLANWLRAGLLFGAVFDFLGDGGADGGVAMVPTTTETWLPLPSFLIET